MKVKVIYQIRVFNKNTFKQLLKMTVLCFYRIFRKCPNFFENQVTNFCDIFGVI